MSAEAHAHFETPTVHRRGRIAAPAAAAAVAAAGAVVAAVVAAPAADQGGPVGSLAVSAGLIAAVVLTTALVAAALVALLIRPRSQTAPGGGDRVLFDNAAGQAGAAGTALLAGQVVPVWQRQLEASRTEAEQGLHGLLDSFNQLSAGLSDAAAAAGQGHDRTLGAGAADEFVDRHQDLVEQLLAPVQALRAMRDEVTVELQQMSELMLAFQRASKDLVVLARHGRLVAMNASIEANRAGQGQSGFGAVAREVLELSKNTGSNAQHLLERFGQAERRLGALRSRLELDTGNAETLSLELRQRARAVVAALVGELGDALAGSRELREKSEELQSALDAVFVGFQFQDRFSQMLGSVLTDMSRFTDWLSQGRGASHADAVAWLKRLDESYTMEQQRSQHHGTVQISKSPAVEFF